MKVLATFIKTVDVDASVKEALDQDLKDVSTLLETEIKNRTPVITGRLQGSMTARGENMQYEVATNVEYAKYVEFGTSAFVARAMMRRGAAAVDALGLSVLRRFGNLKLK